MDLLPVAEAGSSVFDGDGATPCVASEVGEFFLAFFISLSPISNLFLTSSRLNPTSGYEVTPCALDHFGIVTVVGIFLMLLLQCLQHPIIVHLLHDELDQSFDRLVDVGRIERISGAGPDEFSFLRRDHIEIGLDAYLLFFFQVAGSID